MRTGFAPPDPAELETTEPGQPEDLEATERTLTIDFSNPSPRLLFAMDDTLIRVDNINFDTIAEHLDRRQRAVLAAMCQLTIDRLTEPEATE